MHAEVHKEVASSVSHAMYNRAAVFLFPYKKDKLKNEFICNKGNPKLFLSRPNKAKPRGVALHISRVPLD